MNWKDIVVSHDNTHFLFDGKPAFDKLFIEVLKFHEPGLAPVLDQSGAYHIDKSGNELYSNRYTRTFGFYCNRAAVNTNNQWFHIDEKGEKAYSDLFAWTGNYQENICTVRAYNNHYFHIDLTGKRIYEDNYVYAGDYKDGIASVKCTDGFFRHIDREGKFINDKAFHDLGIFHKNFATARDENGWFHIDKQGEQLYKERYTMIEPFYNGYAQATCIDQSKCIVSENGKVILNI